MQRYFIDELDIQNKRCLITTSDCHHIKTVMRSKINDTIIVCNKNGICYKAVIDSFEDGVACTLSDELPSNDLNIKVDIAQAIIRRERFEYMIQKSTELGVNKIIPTKMKNVIVKIDDKKQGKKIERWNILAKEASEQSHRNYLSSVSEINTLKQIDFSIYDKVLVAYEKENNSTNLSKVLSKELKNICVVIGPEGGFTEKEIEYLEQQPNAELVGLGKRILRSETASSYILSVISYVYEMSE